nr:RNA-directed DNA polymerase, eukaryota [Tanacetum cinerariifolium]
MGCNSSFITLIPKVTDAKFVNDFWPISLIRCVYKVITKVLANRLATVISDLVSETQSAFVANRQILDGPFILNEVLNWCKRKRKQAMFFKVDFDKVYDSVRWDYLLDILQAFGFGPNWCRWICSTFTSSMASILVNGRPTSEFPFRCGLKQEWSEQNLHNIVKVLKCFHLASGLKINIAKSQVLGVGVSQNVVLQEANRIGCAVLNTHFHYLGVTVGECISRKSAWFGLVNNLQARLSKWKVKTLFIGGRLTLLKSVLGASPIYYMSIFKVPKGMLKIMEYIRSKFFNGVDSSDRKIFWVAWDNVLASKPNGGHGVSTFFALNRALLLKWVWRFISGDGSLWCKVIQAIYGSKFDLHVTGQPSIWCSILREFPCLFALELDKEIVVANKMGAFSVSASFCRDVRDRAERWTCDLSGDGEFKVKVIGNFIDDLFLPSSDVATRWVKFIPIKVNVFSWRARRDRLPIRVNLSRRGVMLNSYLCPFCNAAFEDVQHVFFRCDVARVVLRKICRWAVWNCGENKSPGPNGYTFEFFRKYWSLVGADFYDAADYFFRSGMFPRGCNSSFITLIPKVTDAKFVNDFWPISLIRCVYKVLNWCKRKRKQAMFFKVDFDKVYDSVRWDYLLDILQAFGFGPNWCRWICSTFTSSMASILVGSPTSKFPFRCGLKQGDPLAPYLFILIMDSLHISFSRVVDDRLFKCFQLHASVNISHIFYADDAMFIGEWSEQNLHNIVKVLKCFHIASGLKINIAKSQVLGVGVSQNVVLQAANRIGCAVLNTHFHYLGVTVGECISRKLAWFGLVNNLQARLSKWKVKTLFIGGRLTLLKSVLEASPIYYMSIFKVPKGMLKIMEYIRSKFFNGVDSSDRKIFWVAWDNVLASKPNGGHGVSTFFALNRALLLKWVWRFIFGDGSLWCKVIQAIYGSNFDLHVTGQPSIWCSILSEFPCLFALELHKEIVVANKMGAFSVSASFCRDVRDRAERQQRDDLSSILSSVVLSSFKDRWTCDLSGDGEFKVKVIRNFIDDLFLPSSDVATRWVKFIPIKVNVFSWRARRDRLPTRVNLSRRGVMLNSYLCPFCNAAFEDVQHVFFRCDVARVVLRKICRWWDLDWEEICSFSDWDAWFLSFRLFSRLKSILKGVFMLLGGGFGGFEISWFLTLRLLIVRRLLMTLFLGPFYGVLVDVIGLFLGIIG